MYNLMHTYTYIPLYTHIFAFMHIHTYIYIYIYIYIYSFMHIYTYIYIYIYIRGTFNKFLDFFV